jgi:exodeoxyribonuclease VII large subunit
MQNQNIPSFTVSRISDIIKNTLEQTFPIINIIGEISNLSITKKYAFFSLKDEDALIRCVIWNPKNFDAKEGDKITATGRITAYKQGSYYQFTIYSFEKNGDGNIAKEFLELKNKLQKEGLFDEKHKKPIPKYSQTIALICGENSAAYSDIIKILETTLVKKTYFFPVKVQGSECVPSVIHAIKHAQTLPIDAIIIARGGGSQEDLHQFNNEKLIRCAFECKIPIISAIGHEIDFTLLDFVSDLRTPTPTAAAKAVSPSKEEILFKIQSIKKTVSNITKFKITELSHQIANLKMQIKSTIDEKITTIKHTVLEYEKTLSKKSFIKFLENKLQKIIIFENKIESASPEKALKKGFALLINNGKFESNPRNLSEAFEIQTKHTKFKAKKLDS